ncbi:MAG: DinB family protein [Planctomycetota bacterium]
MSDAAATQLSPLLRTGLDALAFSRRLMDGLVQATPGEEFFLPACEGTNHAGWVAGHIANTDAGLMQAVGGPKSMLNPRWNELFGDGSTCTAGPSAYPSRDEIIDTLARTRAALRDWLSGLSEAELLEPIEGDLGRFANSRAMLMSSIAFHEGFHSGQASVARRANGLPSLF